MCARDHPRDPSLSLWQNDDGSYWTKSLSDWLMLLFVFACTIFPFLLIGFLWLTGLAFGWPAAFAHAQ
jgi:hypothetical protein